MPAMPRPNRAGQSALLQRSKSGRLSSKKSKTGDPKCSQAMSDWKTKGMTPAIAAVLGRCRAMAKARNMAAGTRAAGNEARAPRHG